MRQYLRFWMSCAVGACKGSIDLANAWAPILGALVIYLCLRATGWEMIVPDRLPGLVVVVVLCLVAAWVVIVLFRIFFVEPARLVFAEREAQRKAEEQLTAALAAHKPKLQLSFDGKWAALATTPTNPTQQQWLIGVYNDGAEQLDQCQLHLKLPLPEGQQHRTVVPIPVCSPFNLRPDELTHVGILFTPMDGPDKFATVHHLYAQGDHWFRHPHPILLKPGTYDISVEAFAANSRAARINVRLWHEDGAWRMERASSS